MVVVRRVVSSSASSPGVGRGATESAAAKTSDVAVDACAEGPFAKQLKMLHKTVNGHLGTFKEREEILFDKITLKNNIGLDEVL